MKDTLRSILTLFRHSGSEYIPAPQFEVALPACVLLNNPQDESANSRAVRCETLTISEGGLALVIPTAQAGGVAAVKGETLRITLNLITLGTVRMYVMVLSQELVERGNESACLLRVRITGMSPRDRALYLEYIGTRGSQKSLARAATGS